MYLKRLGLMLQLWDIKIETVRLDSEISDLVDTKQMQTRLGAEEMKTRIMVIDGQGGGIGRQLIVGLRAMYPNVEIIAIGTNGMAASSMLAAGADHAATGENAVVVNSRYADVIVGPTGIVIADSMYGEITPKMAAAVGQSRAKRVLIPVNSCDNIIVGVAEQPVSKFVQGAISAMKTLIG